MRKYGCALLAWLFVHDQAALVDCFATPTQKAATKNNIGRSDQFSEPRLESPIEENYHFFIDGEDEKWGGVDRRQFFASMVGAAALLALSEDADATSIAKGAEDGAMKGRPGSNVDESSSSLLASSDAAPPAVTAPPAVNTRAIFDKAAKKALGGGKAGAAAAVVQVLSLMWLRTSMNYQYRYGGTLSSSLKELYNEGGIPRLYTGLPFAIIQGPLTRFGDTAANVGVIALLEAFPETQTLPLPLKTAAGSVTAGLWRIFLMPIDTSKTAMQVEGSDGLEKLKRQVAESGPAPLYQGALASAAATAAGHFPWFLTYNFLNDALPAVSKDYDLILFLARSAGLGFSASCVSDCVSNSLRVIKTTKQTAGLGDGEKTEISYSEALSLVIENDGVVGLFTRGLQTRLLTNAIQGAIFSVLWKYFQATL